MTDTKHTPHTYERAAAFYDTHPTGQYDEEAAHALKCHYELLEALENCQSILAHLIDPNQKGSGIDNMVAWAWCVEAEKKARTSLAKARGES